jgi:hypothetical protein
MRPSIPPLLAAACAGGAAWHWKLLDSKLSPDQATALASTVASVGATLLGFMLAALAVLASINHVHLVQMMRKTGHYKDLIATLFGGAVWMLVCTVLGFTLLLTPSPSQLLLCALVAAHAAALVALLDTGRKFWLVLTHLQ